MSKEQIKEIKRRLRLERKQIKELAEERKWLLTQQRACKQRVGLLKQSLNDIICVEGKE